MIVWHSVGGSDVSFRHLERRQVALKVEKRQAVVFVVGQVFDVEVWQSSRFKVVIVDIDIFLRVATFLFARRAANGVVDVTVGDGQFVVRRFVDTFASAVEIAVRRIHEVSSEKNCFVKLYFFFHLIDNFFKRFSKSFVGTKSFTHFPFSFPILPKASIPLPGFFQSVNGLGSASMLQNV